MQWESPQPFGWIMNLRLKTEFASRPSIDKTHCTRAFHFWNFYRKDVAMPLASASLMNEQTHRPNDKWHFNNWIDVTMSWAAIILLLFSCAAFARLTLHQHVFFDRRLPRPFYYQYEWHANCEGLEMYVIAYNDTPIDGSFILVHYNFILWESRVAGCRFQFLITNKSKNSFSRTKQISNEATGIMRSPNLSNARRRRTALSHRCSWSARFVFCLLLIKNVKVWGRSPQLLHAWYAWEHCQWFDGWNWISKFIFRNKIAAGLST